MDSFEWTKIAGAVLSALLVIIGLPIVLELAEGEHKPAKPGYTLPVPEVDAPAANQPEGGEAVPPPVAMPGVPPGDLPAGFNPVEVVQVIAGADVSSGKTIFKKCLACHSADKGGPNKVGPNLWGIVGRPKASIEGFNYSGAMKAKGGDWSLVDLASFLHKPKDFVPGTKMIFPGISNVGDLADLLAYIKTLGGTATP